MLPVQNPFSKMIKKIIIIITVGGTRTFFVGKDVWRVVCFLSLFSNVLLLKSSTLTEFFCVTLVSG